MVAFLLFTSYTGRAQFNLEVEITGFRNDKGTLMIQLFNEKKEVVASEKKVISKKECIVTFPQLKPGKYAVRYFHDENQSEKLETNLFGKPVEGYGFSNNVTGKFGPPPFEKWLFYLGSDLKIQLKPLY